MFCVTKVYVKHIFDEYVLTKTSQIDIAITFMSEKHVPLMQVSFEFCKFKCNIFIHKGVKIFLFC